MLVSLGAAMVALTMTVAPATTCKNDLALTIKQAGFRGDDVVTAWSIAMRESRGKARAISPTSDYGLFQLNRPTWGDEPWWDTAAMLTPLPNARAAYRISEGGKTFRAWGLDGNGNRHPVVSYGNGVHAAYEGWRDKFPKECR